MVKKNVIYILFLFGLVALFRPAFSQTDTAKTRKLFGDQSDTSTLEWLEPVKNYQALVNYDEKEGFTGTDSFTLFFGGDTILFYCRYVNGKKTSVQQYYTNGVKRQQLIFKDSLLDGTIITYYKSGTMADIVSFENGKVITPSLSYYPSGQLSDYREDYALDDNEFYAIEFYEEGLIKSRSWGLPDSTEAFVEIRYHLEGTKMDSTVYNAGRQPFIKWDNKGNVCLRGAIFQAFFLRVGPWKEWYADGNLKREYYYNENSPNQPEGDWKWYDRNGRVYRWEVYRDGNLIRVKVGGKEGK